MFVWQFSPVFRRENCVPRLRRSHLLSRQLHSVFRIAQSLFFWELIFCMFCDSYTGIGIDGIVLKQCIGRIPIHCAQQMFCKCEKTARALITDVSHLPQESGIYRALADGKFSLYHTVNFYCSELHLPRFQMASTRLIFYCSKVDAFSGKCVPCKHGISD